MPYLEWGVGHGQPEVQARCAVLLARFAEDDRERTFRLVTAGGWKAMPWIDMVYYGETCERRCQWPVALDFTDRAWDAPLPQPKGYPHHWRERWATCAWVGWMALGGKPCGWLWCLLEEMRSREKHFKKAAGYPEG